MRHRLVDRTALLLTAALAALSVAFGVREAGGAGAGPDRASPSAVDGARAFARDCAACHAAEDLARELRFAPDPARAVLDALALLAQHGASRPDEDRAIVGHLLTR